MSKKNQEFSKRMMAARKAKETTGRTYDFQIRFEEVKYAGETKVEKSSAEIRVTRTDRSGQTVFVIPLRHWVALRKGIDYLANGLERPTSESTGSAG
jgi:hypothetical protein